MMLDKDPREEKLPKWARDKMDTMRRRIEMLERAETLRQHQDSNSKSKMTAVDYLTGVRIGLDEFSVCSFYVTVFDDHRREIQVNVSEDGRHLIVGGYDARLAIFPEAPNTVKVIPS